MIKCPTCGTDNRDASRFCRVCGKTLPVTRPGGASQLPPGSPAASAPTQAPRPTQQPQRIPPLSSRAFTTSVSSAPLAAPASSTLAPVPSRARPLTTRIATTVNPSTTLRGVVMDDPAERRDLPPRDATKWMVGLAIAIVVVPPLLFALFTVAVALCVLAVLGAGAIITCLAFPLGIGLSMFGMFRPPQRAEVPYLEFRVQEPSGNVVNAEMIGKRRGGRLYRGDEVNVAGEWLDASQTSLRAWRVEVTHAASAGGPVRANAILTADRPWDRKWGSIALIVAGILALVLYVLPIVAMGLGSSLRP